MKINILLKIFILSLVFCIIQSDKSKNKLRGKSNYKSNTSNTATSLTFETALNESTEKPSYLESVVIGKSINTETTFNTYDNTGKLITKKLNSTPRFKESGDPYHSLEPNPGTVSFHPMEDPIIVKKNGNLMQPLSLEDRIAGQKKQTITNLEAFDLTYPTHKDYYEDKKFVVYDSHEKINEDMMADFKKAIDKAIDWEHNKGIKSVDELNPKSIHDLEMPKSALAGDRKAIKFNYNDIKDGIEKGNIKMKVSDPYYQMRIQTGIPN